MQLPFTFSIHTSKWEEQLQLGLVHKTVVNSCVQSCVEHIYYFQPAQGYHQCNDNTPRVDGTICNSPLLFGTCVGQFHIHVHK